VLLLESNGWLVIQNPQRKGYGVHERFGFKKGVPDLLVIKNGRLIFLELKSERINTKNGKITVGKVSEEQELMIQILRTNRIEVYVVSNIDEVVEICCLLN
jgi:hypothetical protein